MTYICINIVALMFSALTTLIPLWISNHMPGKVWVEITYKLSTSTVAPLKFGNGQQFHPTFYKVSNYLSMLQLKLRRTLNHFFILVAKLRF